jgi:hypothetical protein
MTKYKVTDKSYGNYNGKLNYDYAFDTSKFNGLVRDTERSLQGLERAFNYLPGEHHFPFKKPISYIDAKALVTGAYVAPIRAILNHFSEHSSERRANKQKEVIAKDAMNSESPRELIKELNKLNKLFEKYADDKFKGRRKFAIVAYNELGYNG